MPRFYLAAGKEVYLLYISHAYVATTLRQAHVQILMYLKSCHGESLIAATLELLWLNGWRPHMYSLSLSLVLGSQTYFTQIQIIVIKFCKLFEMLFITGNDIMFWDLI